MLAEISMKNKRKKEIEDWMNQLQGTIDNIPESGTHSVSQPKHIQMTNKVNMNCFIS
jgi:hypothetical protein